MNTLSKVTRSIAVSSLIAGAVLCANVSAFAQLTSVSPPSRTIGAGALALDDHYGHTLILETPQPGDPGYDAWAVGPAINWRIPIPPFAGANMAFVLTGPSSSEPTEMLIWDPPSPAGTGGAQGVWRPHDISSILSTSGFISGTGTTGQLAYFTGSGSLGSTDLSGDVTTSGGVTTTISSIGAAGTTAGTHIVSAINSNASTGTINAANGGTGHGTYSIGDVLYATGASTLSTRTIGGTDQVLTVSGGAPVWANSGATIAYATSTSTVATNLIQFTPTPSSTYIRILNTSGGTINITGMNSSGVPDGRLLTIVNISASSSESIQILDHNPASLAVDQFDLPGTLPIVLSQNGAATFLYDLSRQKWELIATN